MKLSEFQPINLIIYESSNRNSDKFTATVRSFYPTSDHYYTIEINGPWLNVLRFRIEKRQIDNSQESIWLSDDTNSTIRFFLLSRTDDFSEAKRELARAYVRRMRYNKAYDWILYQIDATLSKYIKQELNEEDISNIYSNEMEDVPNQKDWTRECKRYILEHMNTALTIAKPKCGIWDNEIFINISNNTPLKLYVVISCTIKGQISNESFDSILSEYCCFRPPFFVEQAMGHGSESPFFTVDNSEYKKKKDFFKSHPEMKIINTYNFRNFSFTAYRSFEINRFSRIEIRENFFDYPENEILTNDQCIRTQPEIQIERINTSDEKRALYQKRDSLDEEKICSIPSYKIKIMEEGPKEKPVRIFLNRLDDK